MSRRERYKQEQPRRQESQLPVTFEEQLLSELLALYRILDDLEPLARGTDLSAAAARLRLRCLKEDIRVARRKIARMATMPGK